MGIISYERNNALHLLIAIKYNSGFGGIKIDSASFTARLM
jgi:hypothetical protein